jgi:hypothetical protein
MSIEAKIDELIAALDRNTAALTGAPSKAEDKPAKAEKAPKAEKVKDVPKGPTVDELKEKVKGALTRMIESGLREQASEFLGAAGAKSATSLAEKGEAAVNEFVAKCEAAELES